MLAGKYTRTILAVMALLLMMPMIVSANCEITSDYFYEKPFPATFCVQLDTPATPVTFVATTPQGMKKTAGPVNTNALGLACVSVNWPVGVYELTIPTESDCPPHAISIFSELNFCGAQGGGALLLDEYGVPPNVQQSLEPRKADFAFINRELSPKNFAVIYHDPDYPLGAIRFIAKSFQTIQAFDLTTYQWMKFHGSGKLSQGMGAPMSVHYTLYVDDDPILPYFCLQIWDFAGHLLYENDDCSLFEGRNEVEICPE